MTKSEDKENIENVIVKYIDELISEVLQEQKVVTLVRVAELWLIYAAGIRAGLWRSPKSH